MSLRQLLAKIGRLYDRRLPQGSEAQQLLRGARHVVAPLVPIGMEVVGRGGQTTPTLTPWIGIRDPDEAPNWNRGIYPIFVWSADLARLYLVLQQGVEDLRLELGTGQQLRERLRHDATALREGIAAHLDGLPFGTVDLGGSVAHWRQRAYEAGAIASIAYDAAALPSDAKLADDLARFMRIYEEAIAAKRQIRLTYPGVLFAPAPSVVLTSARIEKQTLIDFKPKSDADYVAEIKQRVIVKTRRHERLVADYGKWAADVGFEPTTAAHPRDLVLVRSGSEWLIEAEMVRQGNASAAVREAIGQLLTYRHLLYPPQSDVRMVALFSESLGDAFVALLDKLRILAVWRDRAGHWAGSGTARAEGLAECLGLPDQV